MMAVVGASYICRFYVLKTSGRGDFMKKNINKRLRNYGVIPLEERMVFVKTKLTGKWQK